MCACVHVVTVIKITINMPYLIHVSTVYIIVDHSGSGIELQALD